MRLPAARLLLVSLFSCFGHGCATLPRVEVDTDCGRGAASTVKLTAVDPQGRLVPYVTVTVIRDDRSFRYQTATSSLGNTRFPLAPGAYSVGIGEIGRWQIARRSFTMRRGCDVEMRAQLLKYEVHPNGY